MFLRRPLAVLLKAPYEFYPADDHSHPFRVSVRCRTPGLVHLHFVIFQHLSRAILWQVFLLLAVMHQFSGSAGYFS